MDITEQLDPNLDWSTFQWGSFGFGDFDITVPPGTQHFQTTLPMTYPGVTFRVVITLDLDPTTGVIHASFQSLNAATLMTGLADCPGTLSLGAANPLSELPPDVTIGFLPPEDGTGRGTGFLNFTVKPKAGLPTGTQIRNVADVTFDLGNTIATDQVSETDPSLGVDPTKQDLVTIDSGAPTSTVAALPAVTATNAFTVNWSGTDDTGGSGIASYTVYVSDNGGAYTPWLTNTTQTSATFSGQDGHTYAFYSIATDNVGNVQPTPTAAQATTTVDATPPTSSVATLPQFSPGTFQVKWSGTDPNGIGIASYTIYVSDNGGSFTPWLTDTTETAAYFTGVTGHTYSFYSVATDNVGDVQSTPTSAQASTTVDAVAPTSSVTALPASETSATFTVSWSGQDNTGGSGIASYSIYVSTDGGAFNPFLIGTTLTSATFTGAFGHTYAFYSIATDNVGNQQSAPSAAQARTAVPAPTTTTISSSATNNTALQGTSVTFTATVSTTASGIGTPTGQVEFIDQTTGAVLGTVTLVNGQASVTTAALADGTHTIVAEYLPPQIFAASGDSLVETVLSDITSQTSFIHNGGSLVHAASGNYFVQTATLTNTSTTTFQGPITIVFNNLAAGMVVKGATINGVFVAAQLNSEGQYYITLTGASSSFAPGKSLSMSLQFNQYPGTSYTTQVLAG